MSRRSTLASRLGPGHVEAVRKVLAEHPAADITDLALSVAERCGLGPVQPELLARYLIEHGLRERPRMRLVRIREDRDAVPVAVSVRHASVFGLGAAQTPEVALPLSLQPVGAPSPSKGSRSWGGHPPLLTSRDRATVVAILDRNPTLTVEALAALVRQACGLQRLGVAGLRGFLKRQGLATHQQLERADHNRRSRLALRGPMAKPDLDALRPPASVFDFASHFKPNKEAKR